MTGSWSRPPASATSRSVSSKGSPGPYQGRLLLRAGFAQGADRVQTPTPQASPASPAMTTTGGDASTMVRRPAGHRSPGRGRVSRPPCRPPPDRRGDRRKDPHAVAAGHGRDDRPGSVFRRGSVRGGLSPFHARRGTEGLRRTAPGHAPGVRPRWVKGPTGIVRRSGGSMGPRTSSTPPRTVPRRCLRTVPHGPSGDPGCGRRRSARGRGSRGKKYDSGSPVSGARTPALRGPGYEQPSSSARGVDGAAHGLPGPVDGHGGSRASGPGGCRGRARPAGPCDDGRPLSCPGHA